MAFALSLSACITPVLSATALQTKPVRDTIDCLINSILAGEDPTSEETPDQWRARIESYAKTLIETAYEPAAPLESLIWDTHDENPEDFQSQCGRFVATRDPVYGYLRLYDSENTTTSLGEAKTLTEISRIALRLLTHDPAS